MLSMKTVLLVFLGAGLGAVLRFALAAWVSTKNSSSFPLGTLLVNITGSLVIGIVMAAILAKNPNSDLKYFLVTGLLGGYTTFSAFAYETITLFEKQQPMSAISYIIASNIGCLGSCWLSMLVTKSVINSSS